MRGYWSLATNPRFMSQALMLSASMGVVFALVTAAPFILGDQLGVQPEEFGYYFAAIVAAFFGSSVLAHRLADRLDADVLSAAGILCAGIGVALLAVVVAADGLTPASFTATVSVLAFGLGPTLAVARSRALDATEERIGTASAGLGALEMTIGGLASLSVAMLHDGTPRPLVMTAAVLLLVTAAARRVAGRARRASLLSSLAPSGDAG